MFSLPSEGKDIKAKFCITQLTYVYFISLSVHLSILSMLTELPFCDQGFTSPGDTTVNKVNKHNGLWASGNPSTKPVTAAALCIHLWYFILLSNKIWPLLSLRTKKIIILGRIFIIWWHRMGESALWKGHEPRRSQNSQQQKHLGPLPGRLPLMWLSLDAFPSLCFLLPITGFLCRSD